MSETDTPGLRKRSQFDNCVLALGLESPFTRCRGWGGEEGTPEESEDMIQEEFTIIHASRFVVGKCFGWERITMLKLKKRERESKTNSS